MEASDPRQPPFRVLTFRDGQEIIAEDVETEVAARTRFASAVDLCKARGKERDKVRGGGHMHGVELRCGARILSVWPDRGD